MPFDSLLDIIKRAQQSNPRFSARMNEAEALGRWAAAVGEVIAKHSKAVRVKDSMLWVEVAHPIWRSELHYRKHQILNRINGKTPGDDGTVSRTQEVITDIHYIEPRR